MKISNRALYQWLARKHFKNLNKAQILKIKACIYLIIILEKLAINLLVKVKVKKL